MQVQVKKHFLSLSPQTKASHGNIYIYLGYLILFSTRAPHASRRFPRLEPADNCARTSFHIFVADDFFFYFSVSWSRGCGVFFHFLVPNFLFGLFPVSWSHGWFYIRQMGFLDGLKSMNRLLWLIFFLRFYFSLLVFRMGSKKFYLNVYY